MKRTVLILTLVFGSLIAAAPALAGGGFGGDVATGKISGPAVSSTIEIDPTFDSTTKGATGIRLQKGTSASGATFTTPYAASWVMGCDGTHGAAAPTTDPNVNVVTEMTDMLSATRSYEANVTVFNAVALQIAARRLKQSRKILCCDMRIFVRLRNGDAPDA